jgi:hypothetical protein
MHQAIYRKAGSDKVADLPGERPIFVLFDPDGLAALVKNLHKNGPAVARYHLETE